MVAATTPKTGPKRPQTAKKTGTRRTTAKTGGQSPSAGPASRRKNHLLWLAVVLVAGALAAGGYAWWQSALVVRGESVQLSARVGAMEQRVGDLVSAQEDLDERLQHLHGEMRAQQAAAGAGESERAQLLRDMAALSESVSRLDSGLDRGMDAWRLREIERLLVLANQRLRWAADIKLAGEALALADRGLRQLDDSAFGPDLAPVRELLAGDIAALDGAATVDTAGTLNALAALAHGVDALPPAGEAPESAAPGAADSAPATPSAPETGGGSSWWEAGKTLFADLGGLVRVETDGKPPAPILSAELRLIFVEKTKLILESAQLAFMRGQGGVYASRMAQAYNQVAAHFDTQSPRVGNWLERLATLAAVAPAVNPPDISASLRALREVLDARETDARAGQ